MSLHVRAFALACGLIWGCGVLLITWWIILLDGPSQDPTFLGRIYRGYSVTLGGSVVGFIWALVDGVIGGAIFAWLYNKLAGRFSRARS